MSGWCVPFQQHLLSSYWRASRNSLRFWLVRCLALTLMAALASAQIAKPSNLLPRSANQQDCQAFGKIWVSARISRWTWLFRYPLSSTLTQRASCALLFDEGCSSSRMRCLLSCHLVNPCLSPSWACSCSLCRRSKCTWRRRGLGRAGYTRTRTSVVSTQSPPLATGHHEALALCLADLPTMKPTGYCKTDWHSRWT